MSELCEQGWFRRCLKRQKISSCPAFPEAPKQRTDTGEFYDLGGCLCVLAYGFTGVFTTKNEFIVIILVVFGAKSDKPRI